LLLDTTQIFYKRHIQFLISSEHPGRHNRYNMRSYLSHMPTIS